MTKAAATAATYAKIKYDRQIVAIAKVCGATAIYSDDGDIRPMVEDTNINVIGLTDLPLPPEKAQLEMELTGTGEGNIKPPGDDIDD